MIYLQPILLNIKIIMAIKNTECMTVREVANVLKVNPITVYDYIRGRKLPALRIGRYYRVLVSDFESFLEKQKMT